MLNSIKKYKNTTISLITLFVTLIVNSLLDNNDLYYSLIYENIIVLISLIIIIIMFFTASEKEKTILTLAYLVFLIFNVIINY